MRLDENPLCPDTYLCNDIYINKHLYIMCFYVLMVHYFFFILGSAHIRLFSMAINAGWYRLCFS